MAHVDVCIAGGGPAGAALALRLAQLGHSVALVEKSRFPRPHLGTSLTGGAVSLLASLGCQLHAGDFLPAESGMIYWGVQDGSLPFHGSPVNVDRGRLDQRLLETAASHAGVTRYQPARVADRNFDAGRWRFRLDTGERLTSGYFADATGRGTGGGKVRLGPSTLGMQAYWHNAPASGTLVEAGQSAWYWGASMPGDIFNSCIFIDPREYRGPQTYCQLVRQSKLFAKSAASKSVCGYIRAVDATPFVDLEPVTVNSIKVGDAALAIDPLSSQGVYVALGASLHAATVLHTMMESPADRDLAMEFYRCRLAESAAFHRDTAARLYGQQLAVCRTEFWMKRGNTADGMPLLALRDHMRIAAAARFADVPVSNGVHIVRQQGVRLHSRIYAYFGRAGVAGLLREIRETSQVEEIAQRWSGHLSAEQAIAAVYWAFAQGLLERISG